MEAQFQVGFKGSDLWSAVLKADIKKVDSLLKKAADITFLKDNKSILTMVRELEYSHQVSGDAVKIQYYRQIKDMIQFKLNSAVLVDIQTGDLRRLQALANAGADFCQNGKVLQNAVSCAKDSPAVVSFVLGASPANDRYIETIQADGKTNAGLLITAAKGKNNNDTVKAITDRVNTILIHDAEAGNVPRVQALLKLGSEIIDLKFKRGDGHTALMVAVIKRRADVVNILLEAGADATQVNSQNKSVRDLCQNDVRIASMLDKTGKVNELREKIRTNGATLSSEDIGGYLDVGVQVNSTDTDGNTILSSAVRYRCTLEVLTNLITTYHADPNILNRFGIGPVEMALVYRDAETLTCLFQAGVNIKRGKNMLLQYAEANGFQGSVELIKAELGNLLWKAVDAGNTDEIKEMLTNCGAYVDETSQIEGYEGWTTLFLAAQKNNVEVVNLLCSAQANVDKSCDDGKTAVSVAVQAGQRDVLLYLISEGASVNISDLHGNTPLLLAIKGGHLPLVQILLNAGANPYHEQEGITVTEMGIRSSNKNIVYIFEHLEFSTAIPDWEEDKLPPNHEGDKKHSFCVAPIAFDFSPPPKKALCMVGNEKTSKKLLDAAKNGRFNQVIEAIAEGADIRYYDEQYKRPLQHAQERFNKLKREPASQIPERQSIQLSQIYAYQDIVQFLQSKLNEYIWNAVKSETLERVQTLHECGAPLNWCTAELPLGLPGLLACSQDKPDIMHYLLHHCQENLPVLRRRDAQGETVLSLAEKRGFRNIASWVRAKMTYNLSMAMAHKDVAAAKQLLLLGAFAELARSDDETHLHQAVETGDLELVKLMIKAGADAGTKYQGNTLIDFSRVKGHLQISRFLNKSLLNQNLFSAAVEGDLEALQEQHMAGGSIDSKSFAGITPLKLAIDSGKAKLIHYLISRGASLVRSQGSVDPIGQLEGFSYNPPLKSYIQRSVDEQFLTCVIEGDMKKLENLLQLGANIAYSNPHSSETAISLCINYHSVDMLKFLENRGVVLTSPADAKGNYALGIAAVRGNTAVVEYLLHEININKTIRNNEGKTPLDIAQETDHQEVVRLLGGEVKEDKNKKGYKPPKYKLEELLLAVKNCNMTIIKEFIEEIYSRRNVKVHHCVEMWKVSQREKQKEVEKKLAQHYQDLIEDTSEHKLTGSAESQVILTGFLRSLSAQITGYALDPNDPRSYDIFFKNMNEKADEARKRILVDDLQELKAQFQDDLLKVQEELAGLQQQRENMQSRDREYYERISQMQIQLSEEKSARERDRIRQEMITMQEDLKILRAQQKILEDQEKRQINHYNASRRFEATSINLLHFYRTVYLGIEEIFLGAKAISSGMAAVSGGKLGGVASKIDFACSILGVFGLDPLVGGIVKGLAKVVITRLRDVDKYRQKEIGHYISCLATVGEQSDICTNVAYRLTLWYSDQIRCLAEPSDTSKTSVCLHAPARRMAQIAVGIIYSSLRGQKIEQGKVAELPTLAEKLVWCVVTQKPGDGKIATLQDKAAALKKKVGSGPTGTGYIASKISPNFVEVELNPAYQDKTKTWMMRDIFQKSGIIDKEGNLYAGSKSEPEVYKYCYGTEIVAYERGLTRKNETASPPEDQFVEDDVLILSSIEKSSGQPGAQFHLAPGKIDERIHNILEKENLDREEMEKTWKDDIQKLENETSKRTDNLEERQTFLEGELRDKVKKIEEIADEKTKLYENTFQKYQGQLLGKYNELKNKTGREFNNVFLKMQADTRKEFAAMEEKFAKKEQELDAAFEKRNAKLNEHYAQTEKRLEVETKAKIKEIEERSKEFCETVRKETVANFKFSKEQLDQFVKDQIKEIKGIEEEAIANLEAKTLSYKKDSDQKTAMARQELINIMETRTTRHHKEIKEECESNLQKMTVIISKLQKELEDLMQALEGRQTFLEAELRDKVKKIEEIAEEKTKLYEDTFQKYQGQLLGKYNELKNKMEKEFNNVFLKMQADTRKEFAAMEKKFAKEEQELDAAFEKSNAKVNEHYTQTEKRLEVETKAKIKEIEERSKEFCETVRKETVANFKSSKEQLDQFVKDQIKEIKRIEKAIANLEAKTLSYKKDSDQKSDRARQELINIMETRTTRHHKEIKNECESNLQKMTQMISKLQKDRKI